MTTPTKTPWAVLLCKFSDDAHEPYARERYEEIFTSRGAGKWSMPDFYDAMSHGQVDLGGSKVFGWLTLDKKAGEYLDTQAERSPMIAAARQKAADAGIDLSGFYSVVVVLNQPRTLFGTQDKPSGGAACGDDGKLFGITGLSPSAMGQEMSHVYGLDHSRIDDGAADYKDTYDVMSTFSASMADHPLYDERIVVNGEHAFRIGPGLNAANMDSVGWLDRSRVKEIDSSEHGTANYLLRPLHRRDLDGYLALQIGELYVEFRMDEDWDAAIGGPRVLLHRFEDGHSYLLEDDAGNHELFRGSELSTPPALSVLGSSFSLTVGEIDPVNRTAVITTRVTQPAIPHSPVTVGHGPFRTPWVVWSPAGIATLKAELTRYGVDAAHVAAIPGGLDTTTITTLPGGATDLVLES